MPLELIGGSQDTEIALGPSASTIGAFNPYGRDSKVLTTTGSPSPHLFENPLT
jgi:hypothetical protein